MKKIYIIRVAGDNSCEIEYKLTDRQYFLIKDICDKLDASAKNSWSGKLYIELK